MAKKIIVVGGGLAGLSTGIHARRNDFDVEVIEMHTVPGGQCTAWKRKDYRFDYCVHWLVGSSFGIYNRLYRDTGALNDEVEILYHEAYAAYVDGGGNTFFIYNDLDRWISYLIAMSPEDRASLLRMKKEMKTMTRFDSFEDAPEFRSPLVYLRYMFHALPALLLFGKYGNMDAKDYIEKLGLKNESVRKFLTETFGIEDFSAAVFLMMLSWFDQRNAGYPLGGSLPFSLRMAEKLKSMGATLTLGKRVDEILVAGNTVKGVRLSDGTVKEADIVVGACDLNTLIKKHLNGRFSTPEFDKALSSWPLFTPIVFVSVGLKKRWDMLCHTTSYRCPGKKIGVTELKTGFMVRNFNFDPLITPPGKTALTIMFESPWELWENLEGDSYEAEKKQIEEDVRAELERLYPGIGQDIEVFDVATPKTNVQYTGAWKGAYEGWKPTKQIIRKSLPMEIKGLHGFYLAGQWLFPGGGIPPAVQSGRWVVQKICRKEKKRFI